MDSHRVCRASFLQKAPIAMAVFIVNEDGAMVDATLRDMGGMARQIESWLAWHGVLPGKVGQVCGDGGSAWGQGLAARWVGRRINYLRPLYLED